jgi:protoporphyrin/coproporphyrin ferrochelatase
MNHQAILLVNLGSPNSTSVADVRTYLGEFLMDGRVLDAPYPIRWGIVHFSILPRRPAQSAEAYEKIWTPEGSPLVVTSRKVQAALQERLPVPVKLAMRYQNPSIFSAISRLHDEGVEELLLIPLFPHYAMSSYETAVERVKDVIAEIAPEMAMAVVPPYYDHPDYIQALVASASDYLRQGYDQLLFSFHGIPERHLHKSDPTKCHCLTVRDCCSQESPAQETCYRSQCFKTAQAFVKAAGVPDSQYSVAFQSRLGRDPWLHPYTDHILESLGKAHVKKLLVMCPAFVSDCLETLEEIGLRGRETFRAAGGGELTLIPCLNDHPRWVETLEKIANNWLVKPNYLSEVEHSRATVAH